MKPVETIYIERYNIESLKLPDECGPYYSGIYIYIYIYIYIPYYSGIYIYIYIYIYKYIYI